MPSCSASSRFAHAASVTAWSKAAGTRSALGPARVVPRARAPPRSVGRPECGDLTFSGGRVFNNTVPPLAMAWPSEADHSPANRQESPALRPAGSAAALATGEVRPLAYQFGAGRPQAPASPALPASHRSRSAPSQSSKEPSRFAKAVSASSRMSSRPEPSTRAGQISRRRWTSPASERRSPAGGAAEAVPALGLLATNRSRAGLRQLGIWQRARGSDVTPSRARSQRLEGRRLRGAWTHRALGVGLASAGSIPARRHRGGGVRRPGPSGARRTPPTRPVRTRGLPRGVRGSRAASSPSKPGHRRA